MVKGSDHEDFYGSCTLVHFVSHLLACGITPVISLPVVVAIITSLQNCGAHDRLGLQADECSATLSFPGSPTNSKLKYSKVKNSGM